MTWWARKCDPELFSKAAEQAGAVCVSTNVTFLDSYDADPEERKEELKTLREGKPHERIYLAMYHLYPDARNAEHAAIRAMVLTWWVEHSLFPALFRQNRRAYFLAAAQAPLDMDKKQFKWEVFFALVERYMKKQA